MTRIALTDGSNAWFDADKAIEFAEATWWDGSNHISVITGSQWEHETLFYTRSGNWVLRFASCYQGTPTTYTQVSEQDAVDWLITNDHHDINNLPTQIQVRVSEAVANAEV